MGEARSVVIEYLISLYEAKKAVLVEFPQLGSLSQIVLAARRGSVSRRGEIGGKFKYSVHGVGCLFEDSRGREVDVDFADDGAEIFDAWRILRFAESLENASPVDADAVQMRCRAMVEQRLLREVRPGWFSCEAAVSIDNYRE
ncbi:DUF6896 domain-containing protein [Saccharothrix longispora]|uniref:DUF6896 domain-containing protein n=1 Tax=Saccharothrix longispora TaxID=33920 RepID=UPI0028FD428A|nr:hypothetical protein [Saccharothrix longispora]MDU0294660.1 hypothetical protein [Saccharothrix longispora]